MMFCDVLNGCAIQILANAFHIQVQASNLPLGCTLGRSFAALHLAQDADLVVVRETLDTQHLRSSRETKVKRATFDWYIHLAITQVAFATFSANVRGSAVFAIVQMRRPPIGR